MSYIWTSIPIILLPLIVLSSTLVFGNAQAADWKTVNSLGRFTGTDKPDEIFKIYTRSDNGTITDIHAWLRSMNITLNSNTSNTLEIKYPRNYPYTNTNDNSGSFVFFVSSNGQQSSKMIDVFPTQSDCFFDFSIPLDKNTTKVSLYTTSYPEQTFSYKGDVVPSNCISDTIVTNVAHRSDGTISPRSQLKAGVNAQDIVCPSSQQLLIQPKTGEPFCATHSNFIKLSQWWRT